MFKKILVVLAVAFAVTFGTTVDVIQTPVAYAADYLNDDSNYPLVYEKQGVGKYLDISSIVVYRNESYLHKWAENIVVADADGNVIKTYLVKYVHQDQKFYFQQEGESWKEFDPYNNAMYMQTVVQGFKKGWKAAFGYTFT